MTSEEEHTMRRELLHDLAQEIHATRTARDAVRTTDWVRDPNWKHKPSDDFDGCTE